MNKELVKSLILQAMDMDPEGNDILYNSGGMILHRSDAEALVNIVVHECIGIVEREFWSDPHEVYAALDLIKARFGIE